MRSLVERKCSNSSGPEKDDEMAHGGREVICVNHPTGVGKYIPKESGDL